MMIRKFLLLLFIGLAIQARAQIKEFSITCDPADFQFIYDNYEQDIYIPASFEYNGTVWSNVSIRIRGDGSRVYPKKSLKVRFNTDPFPDGRTSINLNAEWEDQSYIQQVLASRLMRESGQHCFTSEHVRVNLNGNFFGLYVLIEAVDDRFFDVRGLDPEGTTYKASLDGSSLSVFDIPNYHWEQKTGPNQDMADLQQLIDDINSAPQVSYSDFVDETFYRSEMVNMISMNILLSLGSTYYHNYFMYHHPTSDKWSMLPWDMDKTLLYYGSGFPYHRSSTIWVPDNPYHEKAIQSENILSEIRQRIVALDEDVFSLTHIQPIIDSIQAVISASVGEDVTDDVTDIPFWESKIAAYENTFAQRAANVLTQIDEHPRSFTVERVGSAAPGSEVTINWTPSVSPLQRPISYRFRFGDNLDLDNNSSITIDNITTTEVQFTTPTTEGTYYYKVEAYDGFKYTNGFDTYNPIVITSEIPALVINEINYNSDTIVTAADWVEIHNPLSYSVNLEGWELKDDQFDHSYWFNADDEISAGGYLIVCRDTAAFQLQYPNVSNVVGNMDFGLGNSGDAVRLVHPSSLLVDEVVYMDTLPWPVLADGYGPTLELNAPELDNSLSENWTAWENRHGTPGAQNFEGLGVNELEGFGLALYPNPVNENWLYISVKNAQQADAVISIQDMLGKAVYSNNLNLRPDDSLIKINHQLSSSGLYLLNIRTGSFNTSTKFLFQKE